MNDKDSITFKLLSFEILNEHSMGFSLLLETCLVLKKEMIHNSLIEIPKSSSNTKKSQNPTRMNPRRKRMRV